jgi:hypothetical protein
LYKLLIGRKESKVKRNKGRGEEEKATKTDEDSKKTRIWEKKINKRQTMSNIVEDRKINKRGKGNMRGRR